MLSGCFTEPDRAIKGPMIITSKLYTTFTGDPMPVPGICRYRAGCPETSFYVDFEDSCSCYNFADTVLIAK